MSGDVAAPDEVDVRDWKKVTLGGIVRIVTDSITAADLAALPVVNHYSLPAFDTGEGPEIGPGETIKSNKTVVPDDCVLFSKLNPRIPRIWRVKGRAPSHSYCSTEFWPLVARTKDVDLDYLTHYLSSAVFLGHPDITPSSSTNSHQRVDRKAFEKFEFLLPPLDEQRRIAEVLRSVDEVITAADAVISGLERAAAEIAERAFPDPDNVELDYEIVTFGDLFDIKGGNQPPKSSFIYQPKTGYVRLLQIRDFESDDKPAYISEKSSKVRCEADDILIARYGASVGRILTGKSGAYNVALTKIVFRNDRITRRYAYHWLKSEYFQDRIRAVSNRSAQAGFNKEDLFPTNIALPPLAAQSEIAEALDDIEKAVWANRDEREQMTELKSALLDDLLSGRLRVPA